MTDNDKFIDRFLNNTLVSLYLIIVMIFIGTIFISSCSFTIPKDITVHCDNCPTQPTDPTNPKPPDPVSSLTFKGINNGVIQPYCLRCHSGPGGSGGVDLLGYNNVINYVSAGKPEASKLCDVLQKQRMPPNNPVSQKIADDVCKWILQGAKES